MQAKEALKQGNLNINQYMLKLNIVQTIRKTTKRANIDLGKGEQSAM